MVKELVRGLLWVLVIMTVGCEGEDPVYPLPPPPPPSVDLRPTWCWADSSKIAYSHFAQTLEELEEYGGVSFWIVDIETGEKEYVSFGSACDWSPDGNRIAFAWGGVWVIDLETGEKSNLTCEDLTCHHVRADFSPCGTKIAYIKDDRPQDGIWLLDLETLEKKWISARASVDWHPDGERLLCDSLIVIDTTGTRLGNIPYNRDLGWPWDGQWSPDGTEIVLGGYCGKREAGIWVMDSGGSEERLVVCGGAGPSWSPDGKMVAYTALSADEAGSAIWIVNIDGTGARQVTFP